MEQEDEWAAYYERHGIEPLTLIYEDYVGDLCATVEAVLEHVGIPRPATSTCRPACAGRPTR